MFTFNGQSITDQIPSGVTGLEIIVRGVHRPFKQAVTQRRVRIPGRRGSLDFGAGEKQDYTIGIRLSVTGDSSEDVLQCVRQIDTLLTGKGNLVFDDESAVTHRAEIYDEIDTDFIITGKSATIDFEFVCDGNAGYGG